MRTKKFAAVVFVATMVMLFSADFAFAGDDINIENTNPVTATGGNAIAGQKQNQDQETDVKVNGIRGNQTVSTPRDHIGVPIPGAYVGAPVADSTGWKALVCDSDYKTFTVEELGIMKKAGSFWDRKGGFWDAVFAKPIRSVLRVKQPEKIDDRPINVLDWKPAEKPLGEFYCEGEYGWPVGTSLARCLYEAKQSTNTTRVVVWMSEEKDGKNSGFSLGTGAATGKVLGGGDNSDNAVAAFGLGGLIGNTYASVEKRINVKLHAYADGSIRPPTGVYVCGEESPVVRPPQPPPAPERKIERRSAPPPVERPACDADTIRERIEVLRREIAQCKTWGINNLRLRLALANALAELAQCTGENGYFGDAIENYKLAEKNYLRGKDIRANKAEADWILYRAYWNWAAVIRELDGRDAEMRFAQSKGLTRMPAGIHELKR